MTITYVAGAETRVNTYTAGDQSNSVVAALTGGGYVVTWISSGQDGDGAGVYLQRYSDVGVAIGAETRVNSTTLNSQYQAAVSGLAGGGYVVTWSSYGQDGDHFGVYMQRYSASGVAQGVETRVNSTTASAQYEPSVAGLVDGGYVVAWTSFGQDGDGFGVYMQRYDSDGIRQGAETLISTTTANSQEEARVNGLADGGYSVTWASFGKGGDDDGIYIQYYNSVGVAQGKELKIGYGYIEANRNLYSITNLSNDRYIVTWTSENQDGSGLGIYSSIYAPYESGIVVTGSADFTGQKLTNKDGITFLTGGYAYVIFTSDQFGPGLLDDQFIVTGYGNPMAIIVNFSSPGAFSAANWSFTNWYLPTDTLTINGSAGADAITGSEFWDRINGGDGNDTLTGDEYGRDTLSGGDGDDVYILIGSNRDEIVEGFSGGTDTIVTESAVYSLGYGNIENLTGTATTGQELTGNLLNNRIAGGVGDDTIYGGTGRDTLVGGVGNDFYFVASSNEEVIEGVSTGTDTVLTALASYMLSANVENLLGVSVSGQLLIGNELNNRFDGSSGSDTFAGGLGNDTYVIDARYEVVYELDASGIDTIVTALEVYALAANVENIIGTSNSAQAFAGNSLANRITTWVGNDALIGGAGADILDGGVNFDTVNYSTDAMVGGNSGIYVSLASGFAQDGFGDFDALISIEAVIGTNSTYSGLPAWSDFVIGSSEDETAFLLGGNDYADMGSGNDTVYGDSGDDYLLGRFGNDYLFGGTGLDYLEGGDGNDVIVGDAGNDFIRGDAGSDTIWGGDGSDFVMPGAGFNLIDGGAGADYFFYTGEDIINGSSNFVTNMDRNDYFILPIAFQPYINVISMRGTTLITTTGPISYWSVGIENVSVAFAQAHIIFA